MATCEEELARAQTTLADLVRAGKMAESDLLQLYTEYIDLLRQLDVSPERLKAEEAIPSGALYGAAWVADLGRGGGDALPETRPSSGASPVTLLQKQAAALGERVSRLEAKT